MTQSQASIPFLIAYVGRSGSSYLQGLLDSHPDCVCLGEILWDFEARPAMVSAPEFVAEALNVRDVRAAGFKFGNTHLFRHQGVLDYLESIGARAIHLSRRNRLAQYVSMRLAQVNDAWRSDYGDWQVQQLTIDLDHLATFLERFDLHEQRIEQALRDFTTIRLWYEDLAVRDGYRAALDFLELAEAQLKSPFSKQSKLPLTEAILNRGEVEAFLTQRGLASYLDLSFGGDPLGGSSNCSSPPESRPA